MDNDFTLINIIKVGGFGSFGLSLLLMAVLVIQAPAQTILIDDFNDGDADGWSTIDSTIGRSYGPGSFEASSGAYYLESGGLVPVGTPGGGFLASTWDKSSDPIFSDGFVRARVRGETQKSLVSLNLRLSGNIETGFNGYLFAGHTETGRFEFHKIVNSGTAQIKYMPGNFTFGVNEWWNIEAGTVGDQFSMKVWRVGDQEPESPQLIFTDSSFSTGDVGLLSTIDNDFSSTSTC